MDKADYTQHSYYRLVEDGHLTEGEYLSKDVNEVAHLYEKHYGSPMVDDREPEPTPDGLRQEAEEAREDARQAAEARGLATEAIEALKELTEHDAVSIKHQHQIDLIVYLIGVIRHGEEWGYAAHHLKRHADDLEAEAELLEQREEADE